MEGELGRELDSLGRGFLPLAHRKRSPENFLSGE
jgi:hypothetical protein